MNLPVPVDHWVAIRDGNRAGWAHHTEPVVKHMRRVTKATQEGKPPRPADVQAVREWLDEQRVR